jgi:hypothetical protein
MVAAIEAGKGAKRQIEEDATCLFASLLSLDYVPKASKLESRFEVHT